MTGRRRLLLAVARGPLVAPALLAAHPARAQIAPPPGAGAAAMRLETRPDDRVPPGYVREILLRWGDRVTADAPPFNPRAPSAEAAEGQFGWDAVIAGLVPTPIAADGIPRALVAVAHPTVDAAMAFPGGADRPGIAAAMGGASIANIERQRGPDGAERWVVADGGHQSRRLTASTLCRVAGPGAAAIGDSARGLLAVGGGAATPWGSLILAEGSPEPWSIRLRDWDGRFATTHGFGWAVELDPTDPTAVPTKRTALGRFAKGDATAALTRDGRAVVYLTDRRDAGHLFRFVSRGPAQETDALDAGTLSVARVTGEALAWLDLPSRPETLLDPLGVAIRAGASGFDHPSGLAAHPRDGRVFLACRGQPGGDPSRPGRVFTIESARGEHGAATGWARPLLSGLVPAGIPLDSAWPEHPDRLCLDPMGRLWIGTDRGGRLGAAPDALFSLDPAEGARALPAPFYGAPRGAALGGCAGTPDGTAMVVAVRTPGAEAGASWDRPGTFWPHFEPPMPPRTALVTLSRLRGGRVGG